MHCGDLTHFGSFAELRTEVEWLKSLPFQHVVLVAGNHDVALGNLYDKRLEDQTKNFCSVAAASTTFAIRAGCSMMVPAVSA